ncbi:MAG: hypothetical protein Q9225_003560 [Loekoesia sp. 1 TL-2023]
MSASPDQLSQTVRRGGTRKVLSCTSCRQRKIKCNKATPCDPCLESAIECIYPTRRPRNSRAQRDALKARDEELLGRIHHLESLLANRGDAAFTESNNRIPSAQLEPALDSPLSSSSVHNAGSEPGVAVDDHYSAFIKQQKSSSRHINSRFWSSLSDEFKSLKQLIEGPVDEGDDFDEEDSTCTDATYGSPDLILKDSDGIHDEEIVHPPNAHSVVLFQYFFKNVDPLCKILHRPTINAYFSNVKTLFEPSTRRFKFRSLEAVTFAVYFAAVTSMSSEECLDYFGQEKDILSVRYRTFTEKVLIQADILNTLEMPTLQGLVIYAIVRRSHSRGRSNFALAGLAMRIAQGLGLHQDGDGQGFSAFEAEMRRRLFWQIFSLDMRAAEDRGSDPMLGADAINTTTPCNLNDEDFSHDSRHPIQSRSGHTDMTLCLLEMDALLTVLRLNSRHLPEKSGSLTLDEREDLVKEYEQRVETFYLVDCNLDDRRTRFLCIMGQHWINKLWLSLYYPLNHQRNVARAISSIKGLEIAVDRLKNIESIEQIPFSARFSWLFKTYPPWHTVAVALAEICNQPYSPLADSAWDIIQARFKDWNSQAPGTKEAMVWDPIKNLFKRARAARQRTHDPAPDQQIQTEPQPNPVLPSPSVSMGRQSTIQDSQATEGPNRQAPTELSMTMIEPQNQFYPSMDMTTTGPMQANISDSFDYWNSFTYDVNALGDDHLPEMALFDFENSRLT